MDKGSLGAQALPIPVPYSHRPMQIISSEDPEKMTNMFDVEQQLDALDAAEAQAPATPGMRAGEVWSSTT
jgi:hypothetical protein